MKNWCLAWLNKKYPRNYLIENPVTGAIINALFCFIFILLYKPLQTRASPNLSFELTMAVYSIGTGLSLILFVGILGFLRWFSDIKEWTILREIVSVILILTGIGTMVYHMGFLIESPGGRLNIETYLDSVSRSFLLGLFPFAFFTAINYRYLYAGPDNLRVKYNTETFKRDGHKYTFTGGLRAEKSATGLRDSTVFSCITILPQLSVIRKFTEKQSFELSYNATTYRPDIYKLNPYTSFTDPYTASTGNPDLKSEITHKLKLVWSGSYGNNFITSGLFYESENRSINRYALIHEDGNVESLIGNMGTISKYGVQFSGSLKLNNIITINPWFRIYNMCTSVNELARMNNISPRHRMILETSFTAIAAFRHDIAFSLRFNYSSPVISMQSDYFSDPLWMVSAEKTFRKKFKAGIVTALPFIRSFTYQGYKTEIGSLIMHSQGDLKLPFFPFWLKIGYQFSSGKKTTRNTGTREDIINLPKKGF